MVPNRGDSQETARGKHGVLTQLGLAVLQAVVIGILTTVLLSYFSLEGLKVKTEEHSRKLLELRGEVADARSNLQRQIDKLRDDLYEPRRQQRQDRQ